MKEGLTVYVNGEPIACTTSAILNIPDSLSPIELGETKTMKCEGVWKFDDYYFHKRIPRKLKKKLKKVIWQHLTNLTS